MSDPTRAKALRRVRRLLHVQETNGVDASSSSARADLVPWSFGSGAWFGRAPAVRATVRWMKQKEALNQDMFLIGACGPLRRWIALHYCALAKREVEYLYLTRDSSESDLKQRREITDDGTSRFESQCVLDAALHGRVLILEGLENAERNVLPILNNLLENREMALEDGRFLVSPQRYAFLQAEAAKNGLDVSSSVQTLVPVHANFRVIAISIPVPPLRGNPLDPPLRSRFQSRRVDSLGMDVILDTLVASIGPERLPMTSVQTLLSFAAAIRSLTSAQAALAGVESRLLAFQHLPAVSETGLLAAAQVLTLFPETPVEDALAAAFPWHVAVTNEEAREMVARVWRQLVATARGGAPLPTPSPTPTPEPPIVAKALGTGEAVAPEAPLPPPPAFEVDPSLPRYLFAGARRPESLTLDTEQGVTPINQPLPTDVILKFVMPAASGASPARPPPVFVRVRGGSGSASGRAIRPPSVPTVWSGGFAHHHALSLMLHSHSVGRDICLVGGKGEGKSFLVQEFAKVLGYLPVQTLFLYKDMTSRDLVQRRATTATGATVWRASPIVDAMRSGGLAVLDGIERLPPGTLSVLDRLMLDRELQLFDGTRFMRHDRYDRLVNDIGLSKEELTRRKVFKIHPSFRLIALASRPDSSNPWLNHDLLHQFAFLHYSLAADATAPPPTPVSGPSLTSESALSLLPSIGRVLLHVVPGASDTFVRALTHFASRLDHLALDPTIQLERGMCSLRQMVRIVKHEAALRATNDLLPAGHADRRTSVQLASAAADKIQNVLMLRYLPASKRDVVFNVLVQVSLAEPVANTRASDVAKPVLTISTDNGRLRIGPASLPLHTPTHPELVPDQFVFFPIPSHVELMSRLLVDLAAGEHLCLVGNQGVGKNKVTDRLLQLLRRERLYIQLHRDTTVSSLTLAPALVQGKVVYEDSPLVIAMTRGYALVVDEIDKAPMEVIVVLKALLEDGEVLLADGRRFVTRKSPIYHMMDELYDEPSRVAAAGQQSTAAASGTTTFHKVHPSFFVIALANPPGFPFLGNDFFAQLGDVFAASAIDNPDLASELVLLRSYAPTVPEAVRAKLAAVFQELRALNREGVLAYPYSTRELVALVKHLEKFPREPLAGALQNMLDFDSYDAHVLQTLLEVFNKHGIPTQGLYAEEVAKAGGDASTGVARLPPGGALPMHLASSFPLPPAVYVGSVLRENAAAPSLGGGSVTQAEVSKPTTVELYAPQAYEAPTSPFLVDHSGAFVNQRANSAPSDGKAVDANQSLRDTSSRLEWRACERHYSSRGTSFSEELFHFTHQGPGSIAAGATSRPSEHTLDAVPVFVRGFRDGFVHFLTVKPFQLVTYDLTGARPVFSSIHLTTQIVKVHLDEDFFAPVLVCLDDVQRLVVYAPQWGALLVIDPFAPTVCVLSLNLNPARILPRNKDRFQDTQLPVIMRDIGNGIVAIVTRGTSKVALVRVQPGSESQVIYVDLPTQVKVYTLEVLHTDRLLVRDLSHRTYDVLLIGASWVSKDAKRSFGLERVEVSSTHLVTPQDPPLVDLTASYISHALPPVLMPPHVAAEHTRLVSAPQPQQKSTATGSWLAFGSSSAAPASTPLPPSHIHAWQEEGMLGGFIVGVPSAAETVVANKDRGQVGAVVNNLAPRPTLATLFAYPRVQELPPGTPPPSASSRSSLIRMQTAARSACLSLGRSGEFLTALSFEREVVLEVIDLRQASMRMIVLPRPPRSGSSDFSLDAQSEHHVIAAAEMQDGRVCLLTRGGTVRVFELQAARLEEQAGAWRSMFGAPAAAGGSTLNEQPKDDGDFDFSDGGGDRDGSSEDGPSDNAGGGGQGQDGGDGEGKGKGQGEGTGGGVGGGKGGKGGKGGGGKGGGGKGGGGGGILSDLNFNRSSTLSPEALRARDLNRALATPLDTDAILAKARDLARAATGKHLDPKKNRMGLEADMYARLYNAVAKEIGQLRVILEGAEAREHERTWLKNMVAGELDDAKLVDGSVGERNIYKRRGIEENPAGQVQKKPKRIRFVMDVSSSMARFNATDKRLDRMVATTVMIMESFVGLGHKFDYSIVGHDGSSPLIPLVEFGRPPRTQAERLAIIEMMLWNASFCESGDHTLPAAANAITEVAKHDADDWFCFLVSDANLGGYGITPEALSTVLLADPKVHTYAIFIAGEAQALPLTKMLPIGHGHVCTDTAMLPRIFKNIFTEALANGKKQSKL